MVALDESGNVVRPALLWNDTRSAGSADKLVEELGGGAAWAEAVGSVPVAAFTISKLRWMAEHEPESAKSDNRGPPPPRLVDRSADRSDSNGRPERVRDHRPRRRVWHRLLVTPHWRVPPRPGPARARPRGRAAARARTGRGRGDDRERRRRLGGDGRQHGRCTRAGHRPRRHRRLARHERDCLRGARPAVHRRFGDRRGFRRCHREVPAAGLHVERRAGAERHCQHARHRSRRSRPTRPGQLAWCTRPVDASVSRRRTNPQPA